MWRTLAWIVEGGGVNVKGIERQTQLMEGAQRQTATKPETRETFQAATLDERVRRREKQRNKRRWTGTGNKNSTRDRETDRHRGDVCHQTMMGQVGSSELKQNYRDTGVKGTIHASDRREQNHFTLLPLVKLAARYTLV